MNTLRRFAIPLVVLLLLLGVTAVLAFDYDYDYIYVSADTDGVTEDGLEYGHGDILYSTGISNPWYTLFDAADEGLPNHNINAFDFPDQMVTANDAYFYGPLYMSFSNRKVTVPGISGFVMSNDITVWEEDYILSEDDDFAVFFDGSDVGLTTADEGINSLTYFSPNDLAPAQVSVPGTCNAGLLFITTNANYRVPRYGGGNLTGPGGDILAFCATNLGSSTAGFWFRALRAASIDLDPTRAIRNISVHDFEPGDLPTDPWWLLFSFTSRTDFTIDGWWEGFADVVYVYDTEYGIVEELRGLNWDFPTLNGTADGLEVDLYMYTCTTTDC